MIGKKGRKRKVKERNKLVTTFIYSDFSDELVTSTSINDPLTIKLT